ncbi:hypothetical protein D3C87_262230 [compost metagenome]
MNNTEKKLSLDSFKAKAAVEKLDLDKLAGLALASCHDATTTTTTTPTKSVSSTCLFPSGYNSCRCC